MAEEAHRLWDFFGGLHLPDHKSQSNTTPIQTARLPEQLIVPMHQHIGHPAEPTVAVGERVLKGQRIGLAGDYVSANVHAPSSGTVSAIGELPVPHPSGLSALCMTIDCDGQDSWAELPPPISDWEQQDVEDLRERLRWAGVVGLGGAVFPTSVKTNTTTYSVDTLILNAAECEPYITCDDRLMREQPGQILDGALILQYMVGAQRILIGIEENKPEAIAALQQVITERTLANVELRVVPNKYPSGGERQLIRLLTGIEVPSQGLPLQVGIVCQNVASCAAAADAILRGIPLISRVVTLTGAALRNPGNFRALIGTPIAELVKQAGGYLDNVERLLMGGPMMGFALHSDQLPLTKGGNCFIATNQAEMPQPKPAQACIRCGACVDVCPARLLPQQLYWYARARDLDKAQDYHLFDCIECGCCAHVCPSDIPLVQYYRFAKTEVWAAERERLAADQARRRHEFREARLARLEAQRKSRLRKKKEALEKPSSPSAGSDSSAQKKAAIEAAMQRVAAKKAAQQASTEHTSE